MFDCHITSCPTVPVQCDILAWSSHRPADPGLAKPICGLIEFTVSRCHCRQHVAAVVVVVVVVVVACGRRSSHMLAIGGYFGQLSRLATAL